MGIDPVTATIGSAVLGAVVAGVQGSQQASATKKASKQAADAAAKTQAQAEQEINRKNAKSPDTLALLSQNQQDAASGSASSTMLTGPQGVDPNTLALGKNVLLGGGA